MRYLSVCSGIEAATVAWHPLGWEAVAYSEIEKFPCEVLKHHYPQSPNWGDMTKFKEWPDATNVDVLVGGTPCQSFSVAGLRKGLDDPRGNLMLTYLAIAKRYRTTWVVWENVPGVLSSNGGKDFAALLRGLAELGYGFAYRVLDAQYFGVAQRRRRVFVVGCLGSWQRAAAVLFEQESLRRDSPPSRRKGQEVAAFIEGSIGGFNESEVGGVIKASGGVAAGGSETLVQTYALAGNTIGRKPENGGNAVEPMHDIAPCQTKTDVHAVATVFSGKSYFCHACGEFFDEPEKVEVKCPLCGSATMYDKSEDVPQYGGGKGYLGQDECAFTLSTNQDQQIFNRMAVRRLTPRECERLQGFPDDYTKINDKTADGPRYKALGNSMAVPVMKWLGERIDMVSQIDEVRMVA